MSTDARAALMMAIGTESSAWQEDVQRFDAAAASKLKVNTTDLRCAYLLMQQPLTAKELADATGLTPAAITTVLDRLEAAKLARRHRDENDRRKVRMTLTTLARKRIDELWGPMVKDGIAMMGHYSTKDLELIRVFLRKVRAIQTAHIARLEGS